MGEEGLMRMWYSLGQQCSRGIWKGLGLCKGVACGLELAHWVQGCGLGPARRGLWSCLRLEGWARGRCLRRGHSEEGHRMELGCGGKRQGLGLGNMRLVSGLGLR